MAASTDTWGFLALFIAIGMVGAAVWLMENPSSFGGGLLGGGIVGGMFEALRRWKAKQTGAADIESTT